MNILKLSTTENLIHTIKNIQDLCRLILKNKFKLSYAIY